MMEIPDLEEAVQEDDEDEKFNRQVRACLVEAQL